MSNPTPPVQGGTFSDFSTDSTMAVKKALRRTLLDYTNPITQRNARTIIQERLYIDKADNISTFPYGVLRLGTDNPGSYQGLRLNGALEVQLFGRPWRMQPIVEGVADLCQQCMWSAVLNRKGLIFCHGSERATLPPATAGAPAVDSEVCTVRLVFTLAIWPSFLTSLSPAAD